MNYTKRLSVIVPGYNTKKEWWVGCVASIVRALTSEDEIIVVDDGSAVPVEREWFGVSWRDELELDNGGKKFPSLKIVRHEKNLGLPSGRNSGMEAAQGRFVTFVDSDDEVREESYRRTIAALEKYGADLAVYGVQSINAKDKYTVRDLPKDKYWGELWPRDVAKLVKKRLFYYSWNKVFRRSFIDEHNLRFDPEGVPCEDAIFNVSCVINKAKWVTVGYLGYIYYRYDGSLLSSYKPTLVQGQRKCTEIWRKYKAMTPGAVEQMDEYGLGWYDERSEEEIARNQWLNIWRRRSPYSIRCKWKWLKDNAKLMGTPTLISRVKEFIKQAIFMFVRAYFYIKPIRRYHQIKFLKSIGANIEKY